MSEKTLEFSPEAVSPAWGPRTTGPGLGAGCREEVGPGRRAHVPPRPLQGAALTPQLASCVISRALLAVKWAYCGQPDD